MHYASALLSSVIYHFMWCLSAERVDILDWALFTEVEKFITANTQELAKDKWLCPLSGKKFKGQEFVRKHILAKHMEKVEEVKQEVKSDNFHYSK